MENVLSQVGTNKFAFTRERKEYKMKKSNIRAFGEISVAHVEKRGLFSYVIVRDCDKKVLAKSFSFRKYMNDTIRTMYTGEYYATGDFILVADTVNGSKEIYRWH